MAKDEKETFLHMCIKSVGLRPFIVPLQFFFVWGKCFQPLLETHSELRRRDFQHLEENTDSPEFT